MIDLKELKKIAKKAKKYTDESLSSLSTYEFEATLKPEIALKLIEALELANEALSFYQSEEALSCRLRKRYEDTPICLQGDSDYFQDPHDLPYMQDMGYRAREALAKIKEILG